MLPIETAFKVITDRKGKPLENGYIYFGVANQNPVTAPIAVYWDAAGTQPAAQPLRTEAGYIMRSGTPANVFVASAYSQSVYDSKKRLVFYSRNSDDYSVATVVSNFITSLIGPGGSAVINFLQAGIGAVMRTIQAKLRDMVSVKDFGAIGDGVADDTAALQAAIDSFNGSAGTLYFPRGVYKISAPLLVLLSGMQLKGESPSNTYLTSAAASAFDMMRIAGAYCRVSGLQFRPGGPGICLRLYAAHCTVDNNRFLAATNNVGNAILMADTDPVTAVFVAGAYTHNIDNNLIGVSGYAFAQGIDDASTMGIQACKITRNQICSDLAIRLTKGGGNTYANNLLQSSSGAGVGIGIDLGASVTGEMITGNYIERFNFGVLLRQLSNVYENAHVTGNHFDAVTTPMSSLGTYNYVFRNPINNTNMQNGWTQDFSTAAFSGIRTLLGVFAYGADSAANFVAGLTSSTSHHIRKTGAQGTVILQIDGGVRGTYYQTVDGAGGNGANTALNIGANGATSRSINAGGTVNASGADYAEYMRKATGCGDIAKGQIVGIDAAGKLTDKWAGSVTFCIKSTDPSYVGGDNWSAHLGARPSDPTALATFEAALEVARLGVDRIAFAGQAPVNVTGTAPGQYIVPAQDGTGIKGVAVTTPTFDQYRAAVGKVIAIETDGRARVIVKIS